MRTDTPVDRARRLLLCASGAVALASVAAVAKPKERTIKVVAKKFVFVPAEIHVAKGETVVLAFTAPEVPMGFSLPDFKLRTDIMPGKVSTLRFTPDRAGSFGFLCDLFCGSGHEDMQGTLIVT
jgi:cytochrome c oxidase subunit 2